MRGPRTPASARQDAADAELASASVQPVVSSVCLTDDPTNEQAPTLFGESAPCAGTEKDATAALDAITVKKQQGQFCLPDTGLATDPCYPTRGEGRGGSELDRDADVAELLHPGDGQADVDERPRCRVRADGGRRAGAPRRHDDQELGHGVLRRQLGGGGPRLLPRPSTSAEARLQETGQERLLQVIGETARLEQREVLGVLATDRSELRLDAAHLRARRPSRRPRSAPSRRSRTRTWSSRPATAARNYQLGPVEITGDAIDKASAVYNAGSSTSVGQGWEIQFDLTERGFRDLLRRDDAPAGSSAGDRRRRPGHLGADGAEPDHQRVPA